MNPSPTIVFQASVVARLATVTGKGIELDNSLFYAEYMTCSCSIIMAFHVLREYS